MRPQEILSMIEEAAGTSMFEEKKDKAIKTMAKKEKKLEEILSLLNEEITPKLDRLREEKRVFLEFQKTSSELERLSKLVIAYEWLLDHAKVEKAKEAVVRGEERRKEAVAARARMEGEISKMEKEMGRIEKQRDAVRITSLFQLYLRADGTGLLVGTCERWKSSSSREAIECDRYGDHKAQDSSRWEDEGDQGGREQDQRA